MIKCEICNREFESLRSLGLHLSHSHKGLNHKDYNIYKSVQKLTY